jgi:hypothetical protein
MALNKVLDEIRNSLKKDLVIQDWNTVQNNRYTPRDVAETTLTQKNIQRLFRALSPDSDKKDIANEAARAFHPETRVCRVLAILLHFMNFGADELNKFRHDFVVNFDPQKGMLDVDLPFDESKAEQFFPRHGQLFYDSQYSFCKPVVVSETKFVEYNGCRRWCRLPFSQCEQIGSGSSCIVYKVTIDPQQYIVGQTGGPNSQVSQN